MILSLLLVVTSCSTVQPKIVTEQIYVDRTILIQPRPDAVELNDVSFRVITADNIDEYIAELTKGNGGKYAFVSIDIKGYETLSINIAELRRYIEQQKELIVYYEKQASPLPEVPSE